MTDSKKNNGVSHIATAVAGVILGAGAVVAGAIALNDKGNMNKVKDALSSAKKQAKDYVSDIKDTADNKVDQAKLMLKKEQKIAKNTVDRIVKDTKKIIKET